MKPRKDSIMSGSVNTLQCLAFEFAKRGKQSYERRVFIESILYSSGTAGTEEPVSFTEYKSFHISGVLILYQHM